MSIRCGSCEWQKRLKTTLRKMWYGKRYGYEVLFKPQERHACGKTGIIIADVGITEEYDLDFYSAFMEHVFRYVLPPFFSSFILTDRGIGLIDPERPLERLPFVPKQLIDSNGSFVNKQGKPYSECSYKWKPPVKKNTWDHGYFLYTGDGPNGHPDICDKIGAKVVGWYYGKLIPEKRVSYHAQMQLIYNEALRELKGKKSDLEFRNAHYMDKASMQSAVEELIAAGCRTIVYQSINCTLYSDFEDYGYALPLLHSLVNGRVRIILADQLGNQASCRGAFLAILKDRLNEVPPGKKVLVILSKHGHPFNNETLDQRADQFRKPLEIEVRKMMESWQGAWNVIWSSDEYVDPKKIKIPHKIDTYTAYRIAIEEGYDYALEIPTEFIAENTDQMIFHGMKKFSAFSEYDKYQPIPYSDWKKPLIRMFKDRKTTGIYCGTSVGVYRKYIVRAVIDSISDVLS